MEIIGFQALQEDRTMNSDELGLEQVSRPEYFK
jgi:hypothetical protein